MFVSVVIPTFNRAKTLPRAVASVLNQSYENLELIIVDDGSSDETEQYLRSLTDSRLRVISTINQGVSLARNTGIESAKGEWIAFLDSDDEWLKSKLIEQIKLSDEYKIIHTNEIWIRNGVRVNQMKKHAKSGGWIYQKCLPLCCISPSAVMIHKDVFEDVGLFDPKMTVCEDYDLWLRITPFYEVGFVDQPLINKYGGHEDQLSRKFHSMDSYRVKAMLKMLDRLDHADASATKEMIIKKANVLEKGYFKHGHHELAEEMIKLKTSTIKQMEAGKYDSSLHPLQ